MTQTDSLNSRLQAYWTKAGHSFDWRRATPEGFDLEKAWTDIVASMMASQTRARPIRRIADMGTGSGMIAEICAKLGYEVIAIDFAPTMLEKARAALATFPSADVREGDVADPPLKPREVDAILGKNILWTLTEPEKAVRNWVEIAGQGGIIGLMDGTHHGEFRRLKWLYPKLAKVIGGREDPSYDGNPNKEVPLADLASTAPVEEVFVNAGLTDVKSVMQTELDRAVSTQWTWLDRLTFKPKVFSIAGTVR